MITQAIGLNMIFLIFLLLELMICWHNLIWSSDIQVERRPGKDGGEGVLAIRLLSSVLPKIHLKKIPSDKIARRSNFRLRLPTTILPSTKTQSCANRWLAKSLSTSLNLSSQKPSTWPTAMSALHQLPIATELFPCFCHDLSKLKFRFLSPQNFVFHVLTTFIFSSSVWTRIEKACNIFCLQKIINNVTTFWVALINFRYCRWSRHWTAFQQKSTTVSFKCKQRD